jgi:hypothetical protein
LGQSDRPVDVEHAPEPAREVLEGRDVRVDEADGVIQLVGDASDQLAHRGHLLALDELHLGGLELAVRGLELLVRRTELLGADAHLVLQAAAELLDGLEALGAVHRERHVVGHPR